MDGMYILGCFYVCSIIAMGCCALWAMSRLANSTADPVEFMLSRGWDQCTCCGCLVKSCHIIEVDNFGGSPGRICVACWLGWQKTDILQLLLGTGERYDRVVELAHGGELTEAYLKLEVAATMSGYQPED